MAIPLVPAIGAGIGGFNLLKSLFSNKPEFKTPEYFGKDYEEMLAAIRQAKEAQYGSGLSDVREALASSGFYSPAALTDVATRFSIAKGADIAGGQAEAISSELGQQRQAQLAKSAYDFGAAREDRATNLGFATNLATSVGSLLAGKGKDKDKKNTSDEYITIPGVSNDSVHFLPNPDYQNFTRRLLKTLFGF